MKGVRWQRRDTVVVKLAAQIQCASLREAGARAHERHTKDVVALEGAVSKSNCPGYRHHVVKTAGPEQQHEEEF